MAQSERPPLLQGIDQFVVVDFEATCEKGARIYPQEIIEFPAVLVDGATGRPLSEFRTYVRPRHHPRLTAYCTDLTGIRQDQVDAGVELREALAMHDAWLRRAVGDRSFAVVTWGDWDCRTMLESECRFKGLAKPAYFDRWVNLRVHFDAAFGGGSRPRRNLPEAVREAGLRWGGRWHCGLDDARNTARLLAELMRRGVTISITSSLAPPPHVAPVGRQLQLPQQQPSPPPPVVGSLSPYGIDGSGDAAVCLCYCGVPSRGGIITAPGPMQGRGFYECGNWTPEFGAMYMCRFFVWAA